MTCRSRTLRASTFFLPTREERDLTCRRERISKNARPRATRGPKLFDGVTLDSWSSCRDRVQRKAHFRHLLSCAFGAEDLHSPFSNDASDILTALLDTRFDPIPYNAFSFGARFVAGISSRLREREFEAAIHIEEEAVWKLYTGFPWTYTEMANHLSSRSCAETWTVPSTSSGGTVTC